MKRISLILLLAACGEQATEPVKFSQVYTEVLAPNCVPCHSPKSAGNLTWTDEESAYNAFVGQTPKGMACSTTVFPLVDDHSSDVSLLTNKLTADAVCGKSMPPIGLLTDEQVELVKAWIDTGHNK